MQRHEKAVPSIVPELHPDNNRANGTFGPRPVRIKVGMGKAMHARTSRMRLRPPSLVAKRFRVPDPQFGHPVARTCSKACCHPVKAGAGAPEQPELGIRLHHRLSETPVVIWIMIQPLSARPFRQANTACARRSSVADRDLLSYNAVMLGRI